MSHIARIGEYRAEPAREKKSMETCEATHVDKNRAQPCSEMNVKSGRSPARRTCRQKEGEALQD